MKKVLIKSISFLAACLILFMNLLTVECSAKSKKYVNARNAIVIDGDSKQVLFEKKSYEPVPMASTTKILTTIIALNSGRLDEKFTVSKNAASIRGSKVGYKAGEELTLKELLFGLMLRSGNDAAITIAEGISGSVENFASTMREFAKVIGVMDCSFESPHGLDSQNHYCSAYDLALITSVGMENPLFREIVCTKEIKKDKYNFNRDYNNINKILWRIQDANGVKTGYTGQAGKCLVTSIYHNNRNIIIVTLNAPSRWETTEQLYNMVKDEYDFISVDYNEVFKDLKINDNEKKYLNFAVKKGDNYKIKKDKMAENVYKIVVQNNKGKTIMYRVVTI